MCSGQSTNLLLLSFIWLWQGRFRLFGYTYVFFLFLPWIMVFSRNQTSLFCRVCHLASASCSMGDLASYIWRAGKRTIVSPNGWSFFGWSLLHLTSLCDFYGVLSCGGCCCSVFYSPIFFNFTVSSIWCVTFQHSPFVFVVLFLPIYRGFLVSLASENPSSYLYLNSQAAYVG